MPKCEMPQEGGLCTFNSSPFCLPRVNLVQLVSQQVSEAKEWSDLILNHADIKTSHMSPRLSSLKPVTNSRLQLRLHIVDQV